MTKQPCRPLKARGFVLYAIGMFSLLLTACATDGGSVHAGQPLWVSDQEAAYPAANYLLGTGQAEDPATAKDRARADLAKVFSIAIEAQAEDSTVIHQDDSGNRRQMTVRRQIQTRTKQVLEGVEIAALWFDPENKRYHALALLRRGRTGRTLTAQITPLDRQTAVYLKQAEAATEVLPRLAYLARAVNLQQQRAALQQLLRVVDVSGRGVTPRWSMPALLAALDESFARLRVRPEAHVCGDDDPANLLQALRGAIAAAGLKTDEQGALFALHAQLSLDDLRQRQGWYWLRGRLQVLLMDAAGEHVYGQHRWPIKQSATEAAVVERRVMDQVNAILKKELRTTLQAFAVSSVATGATAPAVRGSLPEALTCAGG